MDIFFSCRFLSKFLNKTTKKLYVITIFYKSLKKLQEKSNVIIVCILLYEFNKTLYYHMSVFNGTNVIILRLIKRVSY
jgi:hypothetical protein